MPDCLKSPPKNKQNYKEGTKELKGPPCAIAISQYHSITVSQQDESELGMNGKSEELADERFF